MLTTDPVSESAVLRAPGSAHDSFRPTSDRIEPFGTRPALVPDAFVERLVRRSERADYAYDPELAYVLSVIAGWSYSDGQTLSNKLKYYGFPFNTVDQIQVVNPAMSIVATAYFVRSQCGRVGVLSFRGTEPVNAINWLTDADVTQRAVSGGKVHAGFYANLQALWDDVCQHIGEATAPRGVNADGAKSRLPMQVLYVTGHSLGAAMAALAAARIFADDGPISRDRLGGVYTFGQPAVGDRAFAEHCEEAFGKKLFRHVYAYDVVPHLPPRSSGSFAHFGCERVTFSSNDPWAKPSEAYAKQARLILAAGTVSLASFIARRLHLLSKLKFRYSLDDHSPVHYIEASRAGRDGG